MAVRDKIVFMQTTPVTFVSWPECRWNNSIFNFSIPTDHILGKVLTMTTIMHGSSSVDLTSGVIVNSGIFNLPPGKMAQSILPVQLLIGTAGVSCVHARRLGAVTGKSKWTGDGVFSWTRYFSRSIHEPAFKEAGYNPQTGLYDFIFVASCSTPGITMTVDRTMLVATGEFDD